MFSQQELWRGMERNCYCCRPGPSPPSTAPSPFLAQTHANPRASLCRSNSAFQPQTAVMDVDSALCELDSLRLTTGSAQPPTPGCSGAQGPRPERKARARSLSESMASASRRPAKSHSETSLYRPLDTEHRTSHHHHRRTCPMGSKMIGCSLSLPRKIGSYHMVQRNSVFVSDISEARSRSPLEHSSSLPARWVMGDSGAGSYSEQSSSQSSPPSSMGSYRDSDLLEERSRQRRLSRFRLDRSRRLRQPYSIPFRMCQSMSEDSTSSLTDFLTDGASKTSKSTTASPVKQEVETPTGASSSVGSLVRSRSIDNLELAKLRLSDAVSAKSTDSIVQQSADVEQVSTDFKNLQMV